MSPLGRLLAWLLRLFLLGAAGVGVLDAVVGGNPAMLAFAAPLVVYFFVVAGRNYLQESRSETTA